MCTVAVHTFIPVAPKGWTSNPVGESVNVKKQIRIRKSTVRYQSRYSETFTVTRTVCEGGHKD